MNHCTVIPIKDQKAMYVRGVKVGFVAFTQHCIQSNVTHVRGVKSELFHILCTPFYEQKIKRYVKGVERDSKYTITAHDIFAYMLKHMSK